MNFLATRQWRENSRTLKNVVRVSIIFYEKFEIWYDVFVIKTWKVICYDYLGVYSVKILCNAASLLLIYVAL